MTTTETFSVTLPVDLAEAVEERVRDGRDASVADVIQEGVRELLERDEAIERWLREEVVPGHAAYLTDRSTAVPAEEVLGRIKRREGGAERV